MKWFLYTLGVAVLFVLQGKKIPPFHLSGSFLCFIVLLAFILKISPRPVFNESPKGSWIGYLKGSLLFILFPMIFSFWFELSIAKSITYAIVSLFVAIILSRPQDDSWKSANYWSESPFVSFCVMYLVDQGLIQYFWG